jgi:hypothetical protein
VGAADVVDQRRSHDVKFNFELNTDAARE